MYRQTYAATIRHDVVLLIPEDGSVDILPCGKIGDDSD